MCKILGVVNIKDDKKTINKIINNNIEALKNEPDGLAIISDVKTYRGLNYNKLNEIDYNKWLLIHTRTATTGSIRRANAHGWLIGEYYLVHNGMCNIYTINKNDKTDSYIFFNNYYQKNKNKKDIFNVQRLAQYIGKNYFSGVAVLLQKNGDELIIVSKNKTARLYTNENNNFIVFTSYDLINYEDFETDFLFKFNRYRELVPLYESGIDNQVIKINLKNLSIKEKAKVKDNYYKSYQYRNYNIYNCEMGF